MATDGLARKYRPSKLKDYLGERTKRAIMSRFNRNNGVETFPNVVLFTGGSGTGKTTLARILAKQYLCLSPTEDGLACEQCTLCKEVNENLVHTTAGDVVYGVTELNIGDDNGKAKNMEILSTLMHEPVYPAKFNIVILDEVHMASNSLQNSLLKLLEEPPKHLVFILCTTNPEKLLDTVRSRVGYKLETQKATLDEMVQHLESICIKEGFEYTLEALNYIALDCNRVPRDCLNTLDGIASNKITLQTVLEYRGGVQTSLVIDYFRIVKKGLRDILVYLQELKRENISFDNFYTSLVKVSLDAINIKLGIGLDNYIDSYVQELKPVLKGYNVEDILNLLSCLNGYRNNNFNTELGELSLINLSLALGNHLSLDTQRQIISQYNILSNCTESLIAEKKLALNNYSKRLEEKQAEVQSNILDERVPLEDVLNVTKVHLSNTEFTDESSKRDRMEEDFINMLE